MAIKFKRKAKTLDDDPQFAKPAPESTIVYGKKSSEQGQGVPPTPGAYDRNAIDPDDEEDEFPRERGRNFSQGHLRSMTNTISARGKAKDLARRIKF